MPVTLHLFEISPPARAAWLTCKALGIDFKTKSLNLLAGEQNAPDFLKINPLHTVPTIQDGSFNLYESRAIMCYLADTYGKNDDLYPKDTKKRAIVNQHLYYDLGTVFRTMIAYAFPAVVMGKDPDETKKDDFVKMMNNLNNHVMAGNKFVTGDKMTIADLSFAATLTFLDLMKFDFGQYPKIKAFLDRMRALPYFKEVYDAQFKCHEMIKANPPK